jgi:hypothetical protein
MASDEAFQEWLAQDRERAAEVQAFQNYLAQKGVAEVLPAYQILRSETAWAECGGQPFTIAPRAAWPHIVGTLDFIRDRVVPHTGPVEVVSGYREAKLNACSGGASKSAHVGFWALDLVPVGPISREEMVAKICATHARHGRAAHIGLGIYSGRRFHIDSKSFRRWGSDYRGASSPCNGVTV